MLLSSLEGQIVSEQEAQRRFTASLNKLKEQEAKYQKELDAKQADLDAVEEELLLAQEAKKAVKSYLSRSFDEALETISDTATQIVRGVPNMANATIKLEGTKETKDGKVKEEIAAIISSDGELDIPIKSFSGGERTALDFAIDLAVIDFLESKTNKGIDLFILDEPFNGLGQGEIEMALEVLQTSNPNKKIVIIEHSPAVDEFVTDKIHVIRDGATSYIENS
jgi:DNA repair exonuclease SbcCD ATPase subunit